MTSRAVLGDTADLLSHLLLSDLRLGDCSSFWEEQKYSIKKYHIAKPGYSKVVNAPQIKFEMDFRKTKTSLKILLHKGTFSFMAFSCLGDNYLNYTEMDGDTYSQVMQCITTISYF